MIRSKDDSQWSPEDQRSIVEFFNNSMCPDMQFLIVHDQLVRADEWLADRDTGYRDYTGIPG